MVMFNKKYFVTFLILLTFYSFFNLFSDVKVEFLSLSLVEYKEFSLNCGNVYQILIEGIEYTCLLYTSPSPRDREKSRMPSSA